ncbi:hypothetical protein ABB37_09798 [Leptomonas pyrrhocoris]|uniref:RING-type domain-containing protein n=1 Tax=Leptomonas pyrrhocoris TaxID=157538 RepID=A0A0N0VCW0_LEPPY|nr:hypothetical protein ABB37_09798 [Leptomonas pyrrhocoris]XP_015651914.1 hypothetical protein ABB37_09798 [Leptomonas pyrrhocoris]XP_015651915.1 hypothetical protein ABB37_09798 [Leptomonas pyrrhocoris]KPA73474.1 hypothetical protein ABB37_09798 [Leptomonas pyrrhocoris]KPA73475.1 hypothetical protein ABB37_09798 [Leptomonas pyrrhocoris]KPA73476.1 hypothetical protein ABB37_09798 [Leptomonas pyrrhocoris]|eukprot:XP_015651913.1 hypothetical protein ABB37_09798 [Leptomonas pyrrhocoris]
MDASVITPADNTQVAPAQKPVSSPKSPVAASSPLESAATYENMCGICLTEIHRVDNPRGRLNSCDHSFCSYCIKEWAKNTNVCPLCKARFTRIYTLNPATQQEEETKVRKRNYKAWELSYSDGEDEEEQEDAVRRAPDSSGQVVCDICQQSHNAARMIFCDRRQCPYAAHLDCLGLAERPTTFLCPRCTQLREQENEADAAAEAIVSPSTVHSPVTSAATSAKTVAAPTRTAPAQRAATSLAPAPSSAARATSTAADASRRTTARPRNTSVRSPLPLLSSTARTVEPRPESRALYGGSRSTSSSSSSSSSSSLSSSHATASVVVPRARVDFSKPHILLAPPPTSMQPSHVHSHRENPPSADEVEDELYFLSPTSHAVAAAIGLERFKTGHAAEAQTRRQRERAKAERLEAAYRVSRGNLDYSDGRKRPHRTAAEDFSVELDSMEKEFTEPKLRYALEERMVRRWAAEILPVLRHRRHVEGDTVTSEADMWSQATAQARKMVREKLDAKGAALRRRREQLVRAQANREAAALAKLARTIAQHRERDQQGHPRL